MNFMQKTIQIIFGFTLIIVFGCSTPKEDCLDIAAVNFDVSADEPCSDCCEYPTLKLTFLHQYITPGNTDTLIFKYNTNYNSPQNPAREFNVERIRFFISNIHFLEANGDFVGSRDTVQFESDMSEFTVEDNFGKVDRDFFTPRTVTNFVAPGEYTHFKFDIGLSPEIRKIDPESVPRNHALDLATDTLMYDSLALEYLSGLVVFNRDGLARADSTVVTIKETTQFKTQFTEPLEFLEGVHVNIRIRIDYGKLFENIDIRDDSESKISSQIVENLPTAFEIVEILLE